MQNVLQKGRHAVLTVGLTSEQGCQQGCVCGGGGLCLAPQPVFFQLGSSPWQKGNGKVRIEMLTILGME